MCCLLRDYIRYILVLWCVPGSIAGARVGKECEVGGARAGNGDAASRKGGLHTASAAFADGAAARAAAACGGGCGVEAEGLGGTLAGGRFCCLRGAREEKPRAETGSVRAHACEAASEGFTAAEEARLLEAERGVAAAVARGVAR